MLRMPSPRQDCGGRSSPHTAWVGFDLCLWIPILAILSSASCAGSPSPTEVKQRLSRLGKTSEPPARKPETNTQIRVYLDGSESMAGFLRSGTCCGPSAKYEIGDTSYSASIVALRVFLSSVGGDVRYFRFGQTPPSQQDARAAAFSIDFYRETDTRLGNLLASFVELAEQAENQGGSGAPPILPSAMIIVTDGIQSSPAEGDFLQTIEQTARLVNKGLSFAVLAARSEFHGRAFSETLRASGRAHSLGWYDSTAQEGGDRPFYFLVFSSKPDFAESLYRSIGGALGPNSMKALDLAQSPLQHMAMSIEVPRENSKRERNPLVLFKKSDLEDVAVTHWKATRAPGAPGILRLNLKFAPGPTAKDLKFNLNDIRIEVVGIDEHGSTPRTLPKLAIIKSELTQSTDSSVSATFDLSFVPTSTAEWSYFRISLFPGENFFGLPDWATKWSTERDDALSLCAKSLRLKELISTAVGNASTFRSQPLAVLYLAVKE